jgi:hypothetical protein
MIFQNKFSAACLCALLCAGQLSAQLVSGRISATVVDASDAAIPGAEVKLTHEGTGAVSSRQSNETGYVLFVGLAPGNYKVEVRKQGFASYEVTGVPLSANGVVSLGNVPLQVGAVTEKVQVEASGSMVELDNSGQSQVITSAQMKSLLSVGRDVMSTMKILPGVSQQTFGQNNSIGGSISGAETYNFSGTRAKWNSVKLDGQPGQNVDQINRMSIPVAWDAVEEVTVQPTSYLAEHGRSSGVHINVTSKSGTNQLHGTAYYYKRHEMFNAANFFNNRDGLPKPLGRYTSFGGTVGGAVIKDKLFFFASQENWRVTQAAPINRTTLPTALERQGNFSQSVEQNGRLIVITDPTARTPFPGNMVPAARIDKHGRAMLEVMPLPNSPATFLSQGFNNIMQQRIEIPKTQTQLKFDWLPTQRDRISVRPRWFGQDLRGQTGVCCSIHANFALQEHQYNFLNRAQAVTWTRTISANVINELSGGWFTSRELGDTTDRFNLENVKRDKKNLADLPMIFPEVNAANLIPGMQYAGVPNSPSLTYDDRTPIAARDDRMNLQNTLSWVKNNHSMKFGFFYELQLASEGPRINGQADLGGRFLFNRDANNPFDTNHPFANAINGVFREYRQSNRYSNGSSRMYLAEWFAQDTWKATRRLSLDYGIRFTQFIDWRLRNPDGAAMILGRYQAGKSPVYFRPVINPATRARVAQNPLTGEFAPVPYIGAFVPGSGDRLNGIASGGVKEFKNGFRGNPPLQVQPRFGFAYDLFGKGSTLVRGGIGVYKQAIYASGESAINTNVVSAPPVVETPILFFGTIPTLRSAQGVAFPNNAFVFNPSYENVATVYKASFGIQQTLPGSMLLDVAWVGNRGTHLRHSRDLNALAPGTRFQAWAIDTTVNRPLPDNFLRPNQGFQNMSLREEDVGWSNYHGLQVSLNKRLSRGLMFGAAYTWSKAMGIADDDSANLPNFINYRTYLYGKLNFDQTHVLVFNYLYQLPEIAALTKNPIGKAVFGGWALSGISTFASGFPDGIGFSYTDGVDRWGGGDAPRVNMVQNPLLARGSRTFEKWFNTAAFAAPRTGDFGNAPRDVFRRPGITNFDVMLQKEFRIGEKVNLQFRSEFYNFFNHTQFEGVDSTARFDPQGNQINNRFGQLTSARAAREAQLSLRLQF